MSTDMVTLYERILALVPVDELKDGYNAVLSEEMSSTNRAVNDVVAAFAKLQEVREAVRQVQQESTGTRSASLTEAMDATLALQEKLHKAMELISAEMTKLHGKRKAIGNDVSERGRKVTKHQAKSEVTVQAASLKQDIQQVKPEMNEESKMSWASELTMENCLERLRMMDQLPVDERRKHVPSVLSKLQSFTSVNDETKQLVILKIVVLWAILSAEHHDGLSAYDYFCEHTATVISYMSDKYPESRVKAELKRLNNTLRAILNKSGKRSSDGSVDTNAFFFRSYELLIWRVDTMDPSERTKHIPEILRSLKSEMLQGSKPWTTAKTKVAEHLIKALRAVRQWVEAIPDEAVIFSLFGDLVEHMRALVGKIWDFNQKVEMYSEMQNFMRIGGITPSRRGQAQVKRLLKTVKQLDDQSTTSEIDTCIFLFGDVALRRERTWNSRQDPTLKECYDYLMRRMKNQEFSKRMKREGFSEKERINVMEQLMGIRATSYVAFK